MWFKKALFVYHALLVANTDAFPKDIGGTLLQRQHAVEDVGAPVLSRRQRTSWNETRPVETSPTTFESRTTQSFVVSTSDHPRATSGSASTTLLLVTISASSLLQEPSRVPPISSRILTTSSKASSYVSPSPTTSFQVETSSSAREQLSSRAGSATPVNSLSDATLGKWITLVSSSVTSNHEPSDVSSMVLGSSSALTSHFTQTPTSHLTELSRTLSILPTDSRSWKDLQESTAPSASLSSIPSASILSQLSQPTSTATLSLAASDSHRSTPTPTPSVVSQSSTSTNDSPTYVSKSDYSTILISQVRTLTKNTILLPATTSTSNGTPDSSQSASVIIEPNRQTTIVSVVTSTRRLSLVFDQTSRSTVSTSTSPSPIPSIAASTTMTVTAPSENLSSSAQFTGSNASGLAASVTASSSKFNFFFPLESGFEVSKTSTITTSLLPVTSSILLSSLESTTRNIKNMTTTRGTNAPARTLSTITLPATPGSTMSSQFKTSSAVLPRSTTLINATSPLSSRASPQLAQATHASANGTARASSTHNRPTQPTSIFTKPNQTRISELNSTLRPFLPNSSVIVTPLATPISTSNLVTATGTSVSSETRPSNSTTLPVPVGIEATSTLYTSATSTAAKAAATPPPAPLTTTQTAGVAVGSTAGVLLAVIAAIFLIRRYHANQAVRRSSDGSVYPKAAYIYDPKNGGNGPSSVVSSYTLISGGASGFPEPPQNTPGHDRRHSNGFRARYSDPGNPFRDPENHYRDTEEPVREHYDGGRDHSQVPINAVGAPAPIGFSVAGAEHNSPTTSNYSSLQSPYNVAYPSPTLNNSNYHHHSKPLSRSSFHSYSQRRISTMEFPPLSPFVQQSFPYPDSGRATTILDAPEEPFKYDIIMPVNIQASHSNSTTAPVPPHIPRTPIPVTQRRGSLASPVSPIEFYDFQQSQVDPGANLTSSTNTTTTLGQLERFSLAYDDDSGATYIKIAAKRSTQQAAPSLSPVSPVSPFIPVHRGWDDIKRYSSGSSSVASPRAAPAPLNFVAAPLLKLTPPPPPQTKKKKSLLQLRRKEPALAGQGHAMKPSMSSTASSKLSYDKDLAFEVQRKSLLAKLNSMGGLRTHGRANSRPSTSESDYSHEYDPRRRGNEHVAAAHTRSPSNNFI